MKYAQFRKAASKQLSGKWGWAILVSLVSNFITFTMASCVEGPIQFVNALMQIMGDKFVAIAVIMLPLVLILTVFAIILDFFIEPFNTIYSATFLHFAKEGEDNVFKAWGKNVKHYFHYFGATALLILINTAAALTIIPMSVIGFLIPLTVTSTKMHVVIIVISLVVCVFYFIGWIILLMYINYRYSMIPFIVNEHPEMSSAAVLRNSAELIHGHKWQCFVLDLTFIGWYLLSALTLGILLFWVIPYHKTARANFYLYLKSLNEPAQLAIE